jgi:hypothetical protein
MLKVSKVENPVFQTMKQVEKAYMGNWVLISNLSDNPIGGIVRYYSKLKSDGLFDIIAELYDDEVTYGDCTIRSVIPTDSSLGGLGL